MMNNNNREHTERSDDLTGKGTGMQGVDKAPGEEPSAAPTQFVQDTQKAKNKVDGDPSQESDLPKDQS